VYIILKFDLNHRADREEVDYDSQLVYINLQNQYIDQNKKIINNKFTMKEQLNNLAGEYSFYAARREEYKTDEKLSFRVSPTPLGLTAIESTEINTLGESVVEFVNATHELYKTSDEVRALLNTGKPEELTQTKNPDYLFVRPDLIATESGLKICEIETSPFGLALSNLLNTGYIQAGFETLAEEKLLENSIKSRTSKEGVIVHSNKTKAYKGQLDYLADKLFSGNERAWTSEHIDNHEANGIGLYRAFYLSEYLNDPKVNDLISYQLDKQNTKPSITPHLEEKAIMALLWDTRFENFYKKQLGEANFNKLKNAIPKTWIVGQEQYFTEALPKGAQDTLQLVSGSRKDRELVIKPSGFNPKASWAEGVNLLHEKSTVKAQEIVQNAMQTDDTLFIVQEFKKGQKRRMQYENEEGGLNDMDVKLRITPYYSTKDGKLLTVKATGCENTDFIHASSSSINTAVSFNQK
jgi:hypothetical protein